MINEFKIINSLNEKVELYKETHSNAANPHLSFAEVFTSVGDYGSMTFQKIELSNLTIWFSRYNLNRKFEFHTIVHDPVLEAHITLKNKQVHSLGSKCKSVFETGEYNLTYLPHIENKSLFHENGEYITFDIHPHISLLERLSDDFPTLNAFINGIQKKSEKGVNLFQSRNFIDADMQFLSHRILKHLYTSNAKKSFTEVLSIELLIQFLLRSQENPCQQKCFNKNMDALIHARELIQKQAEEKDADDLYDTEIQLAEKVGLSPYQLKTGFKKAFGTPPYQMLIELRLHKARKLLKETNLSILEIAIITGYQSRESLIKAYKNFFKISPGFERF